MEKTDIIILGAGAAGLFAAGTAIARGRRVLVLDHAAAPGEKIRISGGGRCNFTHLDSHRGCFLSQNPRFAASALSRYTPRDFLDLVEQAGIAWEDKGEGQLFCAGKSRQIIGLLLDRMAGAELRLNTQITGLSRGPEGFVVETSSGPVAAPSVIVATGGKSIPKMGATGLGYQIATQFGLRLVETRPGLVPLTFAEQDLHLCRPLAGLSVRAAARHGKTRFEDALLMTHRGLSGPAILQISSYWQPGDEVVLDLMPGAALDALLAAQRQKSGRMAVATAMAHHLPERLCAAICAEMGLSGARLADQGKASLARLAARVQDWRIRPVGSEGYRTAEVTVGGVDTRDLNGRDMQARAVPGLFFIGEVVDVTGWLGGHNFQWAWASAQAAGEAA